MPQINLGNGLYRSESSQISSQECNNCYPNYPQTESPYVSNLFRAAGIDSIQNLEGINRGGIVFDGVPYFVNGQSLYSVVKTIGGSGEEIFTTVNHGEIVGDSRVWIAHNNTQICIVVAGEKGYIYDGTLQEIVDPNFTDRIPNTVVYVDSYFVFTTGKKIFHSDVNNGLSYPPDEGTAEVDPDDIVAPHVFRNQLHILGETVGEVFQNIGGFGFAFQRINGQIINKGVVAPLSVVNFFDSMAFLGRTDNERPAIWSSDGVNATKLSTTAIDSEIQKFTDEQLESSFALTFAEAGANFVGFFLPTKVFLYDITASTAAQRPIWHERTSRIDDSDARWRVNVILQAYNRLLVGDSQDGRIGSLSRKVDTEYGEDIHRVWSSPSIWNKNDPITLTKLDVTMDTGFNDSTIAMSLSDDGGYTYEDETFREAEVGKLSSLFTWNRLGRTERQRTIRLRWTYGNLLGVSAKFG